MRSLRVPLLLLLLVTGLICRLSAILQRCSTYTCHKLILVWHAHEATRCAWRSELVWSRWVHDASCHRAAKHVWSTTHDRAHRWWATKHARGSCWCSHELSRRPNAIGHTTCILELLAIARVHTVPIFSCCCSTLHLGHLLELEDVLLVDDHSDAIVGRLVQLGELGDFTAICKLLDILLGSQLRCLSSPLIILNHLIQLCIKENESKTWLDYQDHDYMDGSRDVCKTHISYKPGPVEIRPKIGKAICVKYNQQQ